MRPAYSSASWLQRRGFGIALCGDTCIVAPTGRTRVSADALVNDTRAPDVIFLRGRIVLTSQGNLRRACAAVVSSAACGCRRAHRGRVPVSESVPVPGPPTPVQRTARWLLALAGWSVELPWPPEPRGIIVVYPHTSNWEFVVGMLALLATGLPAQWVGKDTLFRWPFGRLLRCLGGIPVNRREHSGCIEQLAAEFRHRSWMWLAIAPARAHRTLEVGLLSPRARRRRSGGARLSRLRAARRRRDQLAVAQRRPGPRSCAYPRVLRRQDRAPSTLRWPARSGCATISEARDLRIANLTR